MEKNKRMNAEDWLRKKRTKQPGVIKNFDDFVDECKMLPDGNPVTVSISSPIEQYFMNVADKHGILDAIMDDHIY